MGPLDNPVIPDVYIEEYSVFQRLGCELLVIRNSAKVAHGTVQHCEYHLSQARKACCPCLLSCDLSTRTMTTGLH